MPGGRHRRSSGGGLVAWLIAAGVVPMVGAGVLYSVKPDAFTTYSGAGSLDVDRSLLLKTGLVVLAGLGTVGFAWRIQHRRQAGVAAIRSCIDAMARGEASTEALRLHAGLGAEAQAWNAHLDEHARLKQAHEYAKSLQKIGVDGDAVISQAVDAAWDGVVVVNADGRILYANNMAGLLLGSPREKLRGQVAQDCIPEGSARQTLAEILKSKSRAKQSVDVRAGVMGYGPGATSGGTILRIGMRGLSQGGALLVLSDVTQQRAADEARNAFVAQAAHELRTPLTNIQLYVENLIESGGEDAGERATALNVINQEAVRLERIVADMLSVSEIEAGGLTLRIDDVRLDAIFEDLKRDFAAQAADKHLTLAFNLPPKMPVLRGDRDRIVLALHNMVGNALKYTPTGGRVEVSLRVAEEGQPGEHVMIDVRDTGIGISPEEQNLIFERFYRSKDGRISGITGTGLGLTLAREVARLHRGDVTVQSEINKGSTFTLKLPKAA